jgi:hypothetical protein
MLDTVITAVQQDEFFARKIIYVIMIILIIVFFVYFANYKSMDADCCTPGHECYNCTNGALIEYLNANPAKAMPLVETAALEAFLTDDLVGRVAKNDRIINTVKENLQNKICNE